MLDPVFLLGKNVWLSLLSAVDKLERANYILVYDFFQDDDYIKDMAFKIKKKFGYKIVSVMIMECCHMQIVTYQMHRL